MKSVTSLVEPDDIHAFTRKLWRSDVFKKSHDEGGLVHDVIDRFARLPRFFYVPSDEHKEAPHFAPWWGGIQLRRYDNAAVQDLYYIHEIEHAGTMPYIKDMNRVTFKNKIRDNEHEASTLSEMTIYFDHPELRAQTFPHEIYVDRFLFPAGDLSRPDARMMERWRTEPDLVRKELMYARAAVVTSKTVTMDDPVAFWLNKFANQGRQWVDIWAERYALVEEGMIRFREDCAANGRAPALERHLAWLRSPGLTDGTAIPFHREAAAFAAVYAENKRLYRESMERKAQAPVTYTPQQKPPAP